MSEKEDLVEDVESRGLVVGACLISSKGIPSRRFRYDLEKRAYKLTERGSMSRFHGSLERRREVSENQNAFLLNDFNKIHEK